MDKQNIRTRFAPSPTGYMHIGNLRTALYAYLFAKSQKGNFILRIEDTDQKRLVEDATQVIYDTLKAAEIQHDEGPDIGGDYGPYIQSERKNMYKEYALWLVAKGFAYYCFCQQEANDTSVEGYNRHCRSLSKEEIETNLTNEKPFVIRQKIPLEGTTSFIDLVFGEITVENKTLDDQILLKSDGMPTYNFANVVDDFLMKISHIIRGSEYLSSNPKYILLYQSFGWEIPSFIHLPLIVGKNEDGSVTKLSKRHGAVSFQELVKEGYLPSAIINYIALLGWSPKTEQEIFTMEELIATFSVSGIHKSPAVFDYQKLDWVNSEHIKLLSFDLFSEMAFPYSLVEGTVLEPKWTELAQLLRSRIHKFSEIPEMIQFFYQLAPYNVDLFVNKKNKSTLETSKQILTTTIDTITDINNWQLEVLTNRLTDLAEICQLKLGQLMWPLRLALSGLIVTPGGATEIMSIIGKAESLKRLQYALKIIDLHVSELSF